MSSDNIPATKNSSLFLSLFSRKKRPNRSIAKSLDDNKKINSSSSIPFLSNGKTITNNNNHSHNSNSHLNITTHKNGYNNLGNTNSLTVPFESASTSWAKEFQLSQQQYHHHQQKQQQQEQHQQQQQQYHQQQQQYQQQQQLYQQQQQYHQQQQQYQQQQQQHVDLTFMDHVRYNNSYRNHNKNINVDDLSSLPLRTTDTVSNIRSRSESRTVTEKSPVLLLPKKAYSVDAMNQTNSVYLMEALETLGDVQPRVARSIPKHANVDTSNFAARSLENCLFDATVYDAMLHDSLKVCLKE
uniref:Ovate family protein n=1 Tax=Setaria digitata TaxID=48799 RepID=A0A915Q3N6_9BILA